MFEIYTIIWSHLRIRKKNKPPTGELHCMNMKLQCWVTRESWLSSCNVQQRTKVPSSEKRVYVRT